MATAIIACGSPQSLAPIGGDDSDGGAGDDASSDGGPRDAGVTPDSPDASPPDGPPPDGAPPGDLAGMCGSVPTTTEDWERCRVKRYCETLVHCSEQNLYTDAQECIALSNAVSGGEIAFDTSEKVRAVAAGRASINVAAFTQCLNEFSTGRCSTAATAASCAARYTGTVADGQACLNDAECISPGASCAPADCGDSCCMGTCTPRAKLNQACHDFAGCEPGLICSLATSKCVVGDVGGPCRDRLDCDAGGWCDCGGDPMCKNGVCRADLAEGALCDSLLQCGGETSCVGKIRPVEPARCRRLTFAGDVCDWFCFGNLYCDLTNSQGLGVCRSLPRRDEPCSDLLPCIGQNDRCAGGKCVPRTGPGQPCSDGTCLPGLFCTDQLAAMNPVCRAPFEDSESGCKQDAQCRSHLCTGNQTTAGQCLPARVTCP